MAVDMFLKITDVKGESKDKSNPGQCEIESFSWGATQLGTSSPRDRCRRRQGLDERLPLRDAEQLGLADALPVLRQRQAPEGGEVDLPQGGRHAAELHGRHDVRRPDLELPDRRVEARARCRWTRSA